MGKADNSKDLGKQELQKMNQQAYFMGSYSINSALVPGFVTGVLLTLVTSFYPWRDATQCVFCNSAGRNHQVVGFPAAVGERLQTGSFTNPQTQTYRYRVPTNYAINLFFWVIVSVSVIALITKVKRSRT